MLKNALLAALTDKAGREVHVLVAGSVCVLQRNGAAVLTLDAAGIDALMALLMEAGEHIETAPAAQRSLPLRATPEECARMERAFHAAGGAAGRLAELRAAGAL